ncbi:MAG: transcription termination factor NusA [bacterium]
MKGEFQEALTQLEKGKGISREVLVKAIEDALSSAYKKNYGKASNIVARLDKQTGEAQIFSVKKVVEKVSDPKSQITLEDARKKKKGDINLEDTLEIELTPKDFGRIAAQTAKQVIIQRIKEAERGLVFETYKDKVGSLVSGTIQRISQRNIFVDLGKTEAILLPREQLPKERYRVGDRLKAYLLEVKNSSKGPQLTLSRTYPEMVRKLFEMEVPEIYEGIVEIKAVSREPGARSKIAVYSKEKGVDAVGACVGMRGMRVQAIIKELGGEKIDITQYSDDPVTFITNALNPAQISQVILDESKKTATVIVPDNQLSLAIGKEGQNVRLAAKLTNWRIDIKKETELAEKESAAKAKAAEKLFSKPEPVKDILDIPGVGEVMKNRLSESGIHSLEDVVRVGKEGLLEVPGIGKATATKIFEAAKAMLEG